MSYRIEVSKTSKAICQATHCKKEQTKIQKGELRQGTLVTINEHTQMKYRHWGCVTPKVLANWKESSGMDPELIDGYEDLPEEAQEKVKRALEQGHVDDEDWNGDLEMNRYNPDKPMQGMFVKTPKKKKDTDDGDDNVEESPTKKQATKKRGRAKQDNDEDDVEPAPKKAKGKTKKAVKAADDDEPEQAAPTKKAKKGKKTEAENVDDAEPEPVPAPKKGRGRKTKSAATIDPVEEEPAPVEDAPPKKAGRKRGTAKPAKAVDNEQDSPKTKPQERQGRGKRAAASGQD